MLVTSLKKYISIVLLVSILCGLSPFGYSTVKALGEVPTGDFLSRLKNTITSVQTTLTATNTYKDLLNNTVLRQLAATMMEALLRQMTADIVGWINSGFKGSPAFVTNPGGLLTDLADETIGEFIGGSNLDFLCSPFKLDIRIALAQSYRPYNRNARCTVTKIIGNVNGFIDGNNSGGSWENWLERTTRPENNPYTSFLMAQNEISIRLAGQQQLKRAEINWGNGFMSWQKCTDTPVPGDASFVGPVAPQSGQEYLPDYLQSSEVAPAPQVPLRRPQTCETETPGSVIAGQLDWALSSDIRKGELVKDIDQIIGALVGQMAKQVLGGIGGLLGASRPQQRYGGQSFLNTYNYANYDALKLAEGNRRPLGLTSSSTAFSYATTTLSNAEIARRIASSTEEFMARVNAERALAGVDDTDISGGNTNGSNLAISKEKVNQSSTYLGSGAHLASDGSLYNIVSSYTNQDGAIIENDFSTVARTQVQSQPWWEIDLDKTYMVNTVLITPRGNAVSEVDQLKNFHVFASNTSLQTVADFRPNNTPPAGVFRSAVQTPPPPYNGLITVPIGRPARFIRIQALGTMSLQLAEVRVLGVSIRTTPTTGGDAPIVIDDGANLGDGSGVPLPLQVLFNPEAVQHTTLTRYTGNNLASVFSSTFNLVANKNTESDSLSIKLRLKKRGAGGTLVPVALNTAFGQLSVRITKNGAFPYRTPLSLDDSEKQFETNTEVNTAYPFLIEYSGISSRLCLNPSDALSAIGVRYPVVMTNFFRVPNYDVNESSRQSLVNSVHSNPDSYCSTTDTNLALYKNPDQSGQYVLETEVYDQTGNSLTNRTGSNSVNQTTTFTLQ